MKHEFYDRSKRAGIYNTIFRYKKVSLALLAILTILLTVFFFIEKPALDQATGGRPSAFIIVAAVCIVFFAGSVILDFYILSRTIAIGKRLDDLAYIDHLTGLPNRHSCDLLIESFSDPERLRNAGFLLMQLSNLHSINSSDGHTGGNWLISEFSNILEDVADGYGYVGRNGGNEFIMLMDDCDADKANTFLMELTKRIKGYNEMNVGSTIEVTYTKILNCDEHKESISELISLGYKKIRETPQTFS